jgi:Tfp pilus assembly protein PilO
MMRLIFPMIIVAASIGLFVSYTNPMFQSLKSLRTSFAAYDEALSNSKKLLDIRNELTDKYNALLPQDRRKLETLLPDNIDNIRFILDIEEIARPYGMRPRDVEFDPNAEENSQKQTPQTTPGQIAAQTKSYGEFELDFSVIGTYQEFLGFVGDLERNLRLIDIISVDFSSVENTLTPLSNEYKFNLRVKTYWLKS